MIELLQKNFPAFATGLSKGLGKPIEDVKPPATAADIEKAETRLGFELPSSYKRFVLAANGFWLWGGTFQFHGTDLFVHDFPPYDSLTPVQKRAVAHKGGSWPPPSEGMVCFAEFFAEADGDQVLLDVKHPTNGEPPVVYYAHERSPPTVRTLTAGFEAFIGELLNNSWFER
jgi:hypothetical protein